VERVPDPQVRELTRQASNVLLTSYRITVDTRTW
jgi:hypothetical protein